MNDHWSATSQWLRNNVVAYLTGSMASSVVGEPGDAQPEDGPWPKLEWAEHDRVGRDVEGHLA